MQSVIRTSEQRVNTQRKSTEAARARACRQHFSMVVVGTLLLAAFVVINILLLRDFLKQPFALDTENQRFLGPLLRERMRRARQFEARHVADHLRFGEVASWMRGKKSYNEAVMHKVREMEAADLASRPNTTAPRNSTTAGNGSRALTPPPGTEGAARPPVGMPKPASEPVESPATGAAGRQPALANASMTP